MARALRIALDMTLSACKILKSNAEVAWPYMKVECVPPMTMEMFQGSFGKSLENTVSGAMNGFMKTISETITKMDLGVKRKQEEAEAAVIAAQQKAKAEELKKKLEAEKKALDAQAKQKPATAPKSEPEKKEEKKDTKKEEKKAKKEAKKAKKAAKKAKKGDKKPPKQQKRPERKPPAKDPKKK